MRSGSLLRAASALTLLTAMAVFWSEPAPAQNTGTLRGVWLQTFESKTESRVDIISVLSSSGECSVLLHFLSAIEDEIIAHIAFGDAGTCRLSADGRTFSAEFTETGDSLRCRSSVAADRLTLSACTIDGKPNSLRGTFRKVSGF
jgi:hypothetical protein